MTKEQPLITLERALGLVDGLLEETLGGKVPLLAEASRQMLRSGGKRLRPRLVLLAHEALGGNNLSKAVTVAATVELLHTASLIHDDINDHSDMRRGQPSVNARLGNSLALLVGDYAFIRVLELLAELNARIIRVLAECCTAIVEGETLQMLQAKMGVLSEEEHLRAIELKTASLFAACSETGAIVAEGSEGQVRALRDYGLHLGMAFQLRDDVLDYIGDGTRLGKPVYSDLQEGKLSLAPLYAIQHRRDAREILTSGDGGRIRQLLAETGALDYATACATSHAQKAIEAICPLPASPAKEALGDLATLAVTRDR